MPVALRRGTPLNIATPTLATPQGHFSTFAITEQEVYAWGLNNYGQLGIPADEAVEVLHPVRVPSLHGAWAAPC